MIVPEEPSPFSALLRRYRRAAGLTQEALADRAGLSVRGIADLERGARRFPHANTIDRLVDGLHLSQAERAALTVAGRRADLTFAAVGPMGQPTERAASRPLAPLRAPLSSFIGREQQIREIRRLLGESRLVTLLGVGGVGKTRLAIEVIREVADVSAVGFVDLAPLADPALVVQALATALGVREERSRSLRETLAVVLRDQHLLIVLDNCEHLILACAELAEMLLGACKQLRVLTTSREALGIAGEMAFRVPPLRVPAMASSFPTQELLEYDAVRLFVERASASGGFELTDRNAAGVIEVCVRLDGIPLALELAAARVPVLSLKDIAARLDDRFHLLTGGSRTALPRHQTLRGTLDWSYALLSEAERRLFYRLAIFAGGWTLEAAEAVCADEGIAQHQILELLAQLVGKSLVVVENEAADLRYRQLETVRQYAAEKLLASADEPALHRRHLQWLLLLADQFEKSMDGPDQAPWLDRMAAELDNVRAALRWSAIQTSERETGLRLASALEVFWYRRGHVWEGCQHLDRLLDRSEDHGAGDGFPSARVKALTTAGWLRLRQGSPAAARTFLDEALLLARVVGEVQLIGPLLNYLSQVAFQEGEPVVARRLLEEALGLAEGAGAWPRWYMLRLHLGEIATAQGEWEEAKSLYQQCLDLGRQLGDALFSARVLYRLGNLAIDRGDLTPARAYLEESLAIFVSAADPEATRVLASLAGLAAACFQLQRALRLAGGTLALRHAQAATVLPIERARLERVVEPARRALGEAAATRAWAEGEAMNLHEIVGYALRHESVSDSSPLTEREREVTILLTQGLSNRELAARLVISEGTAKRHIENILSKLGLRSRTQLAAWAVQEGVAVAGEVEDGPEQRT